VRGGKGVKSKSKKGGNYLPAFHGNTEFEFVEAIVGAVWVIGVVISWVVEVAKGEVWG
jgi:hypothetical protein